MTANNNTKNKKDADEDWFGELLVGLVTLTGKGLWWFTLRWPDTAALLTVFAVTSVLAGVRWACALTMVCASSVWWWRLGWPESYDRLIGKPVADYRRALLVYRRR
jgi:S-DNA-T family DNA segregation ATPase FtsK/SpoIIIE